MKIVSLCLLYLQIKAIFIVIVEDSNNITGYFSSSFWRRMELFPVFYLQSQRVTWSKRHYYLN